MKKNVLILATVFVFFGLFASNASAQTYKFGGSNPVARKVVRSESKTIATENNNFPRTNSTVSNSRRVTNMGNAIFVPGPGEPTIVPPIPPYVSNPEPLIRTGYQIRRTIRVCSYSRTSCTREIFRSGRRYGEKVSPIPLPRF